MNAIGMFLKLFLAYTAYQAKQNQTQIARPQVRVIDAQNTALLELKNKDGAVIPVLGTRGTGKTELAYRLAEFIGKPTYAVSPEQNPRPTFITRVSVENFSEAVPPRSTLILDDTPVYMSSRDYHDALVQQVEKIVPMVRHDRKLHLIVVTQSGSFIDKWLLDADAVLLKPQSILSIDIERPGIRKIYEFANPYFEGKDMEWVRRHAYLVTPTYKGLIEVKMTN